MEQNGIRPIDNTIQKELRDALEEAENYKMRQNGYKICSLEEQMICVMISTPLKLEDIYNLTIRKFEKVLARVDAKLHYQIYLSASLSGFVKRMKLSVYCSPTQHIKSASYSLLYCTVIRLLSFLNLLILSSSATLQQKSPTPCPEQLISVIYPLLFNAAIGIAINSSTS